MTTSSDDIATGRRVLETEITGLRALAEILDENFVACLDVMAAIKDSGRIVVTGMGKSGHVARKIAATLASTGTPAHYVHPAEASHGDMGMITPSDAVLALSNSGETPELNDLVAYAKRHSIPLIAMTAHAGSALDKAATVSLIVPNSKEACPETLAPTTSTTVMIALGDAIAVALLERIGFRPTISSNATRAASSAAASSRCRISCIRAVNCRLCPWQLPCRIPLSR